MPFRREALQTSIAGPVVFEGVGVHSGQQVRLTLQPAAAGTGIVFIRTDEDAHADKKPDAVATRRNVIAASPALVSHTRLGTTLSNAYGVSIATVEHLMAALAICGVDNLVVEVDAAEAPIMDGSAWPFVTALLEAGLKTQDAPRHAISLSAPLEIRDGERYLRAEPAERLSLHVEIDFPDEPCIGRQHVEIDFDNLSDLRTRLARARTFCRMREVDALRAEGLCLGGSLDNAIVVDQGDVKKSSGSARSEGIRAAQGPRSGRRSGAPGRSSGCSHHGAQAGA